MHFFHSTNPDAAEKILKDGFRAGSVVNEIDYAVQWSDDTILRIDLTED